MDLCACVRTTLLCYGDFIITMELGSVRPPPVYSFSELSEVLCIIRGEGSGTPLWYSCLENPTDRGAW